MKRIGLFSVAMVWTAAAVMGTAAAPGLAADDTVERRLAGELELLARQALAIKQDPDEHQLAIASTLLAEATKLSPKDANLWRLRIEAADLADDAKALRAALSGYLKAEPTDDAAQLRLIDLIVSEKDTAEDRLATYGRLLQGRSAESLSAPLRSRVAARAALLGRELGDQATYKKWLKLAVSLDTTNRGAMGEIMTILSQKATTTGIEQAQALMLLYAADPTNAELRWQVAGTLHRCGLYRQALPWYGSAQVMSTVSGTATPADRVGDWALCLWGAGEAKDAISLIDSYETAMTQQAAAQAKAAGKEPSEAPAAIEARLYSIRASLHRAMDDEAKFEADVAALLLAVDEAAKGEDATADAIVRSAWARLFFDKRTNVVSALIERAEKAGAGATTLTRLRGWSAVRSGDHAGAIKLVEPLADGDLLSALALAEALAGDESAAERRTELLRRVFAADPASMAARTAAARLEAMDVRPAMDETCATIGRIVAQTPQELRELGITQTSPIRVRVEPVKRSVRYGEAIELDVSVVNTLATPLTLGANGTVPSVVFLVPTVSAGGGQKPTTMQPVIVDLGRRLVLGANASVTARVRLTSPPMLALLRMRPDQTVRVTVKAMLNPRVGPRGMTPGVLGGVTPSPVMARLPLPITPQNIDNQLAVLDGEDRAASATAAAWLALLAASIPADAPDEQTQRADAVAGRIERAYKKFDAVQRAYLMSRMLQASDPKARLAKIVDAAVASEVPTVQYALLLTQVDGSASTILESSLRRKHTPEGEFAMHVRELWRTIEAAREEAEKRKAEAEAGGASEGGDKPPADEPEK